MVSGRQKTSRAQVKLLCELILDCDVSVKKVFNPFLFR